MLIQTDRQRVQILFLLVAQIFPLSILLKVAFYYLK
nr:MAG TPA: hypothetical protein [Caudoviricetes sp.]